MGLGPGLGSTVPVRSSVEIVCFKNIKEAIKQEGLANGHACCYLFIHAQLVVGVGLVF